ncbi:ABC transporter ATP-binding protein/permease [Microbacterium sp. zg.Y1090]|uniref:ABC transporter ATP-binding protein n=1 Tax=Microbacterium TaxID=33882 RepID=UPI00214D1261|nr:MULTISPECIES: ABC transporter ATP-binding protein [unclassified Microbacterium]MCR2813682.1 ABC transporter ATP-binding protein/permease [Microbacterium sp. zg.Y1084]MCR2817985.1 ABC transporter ATP-binding protein/permease [Microbacterium sp. zg.Y1090]MDL5488097.1 ABC transporter ATP-binding protein [Microbacterium sp. zg-Y1211]WIM27852.1 ABC transporter ATP-binding protein [Microbacterium sp. zg-Y1090]
MSSPRPSRGRRGRSAASDGPRASLKQLLPFLLEHKRVLVVVAALSVFEALATLGQPLVVGQVIERVQGGEVLGTLVWVLVGLVVASSLIGAWQHYLLQRTGTAVVYSSRRRLIARLLHLPIREFDARRTGDLVSRVGTDTTLLYAVLTQGFADSIGSVLIFVGAMVAMLLIDPLLLLLILVVIGASATVVGLLSGRIRSATQAQQQKVGELSSGVERAIGSIRTIRAAGAAEREQQAIDETARGAYDAGVRVAKASALVVPVAGVALQVSLLVVLGVGGFRVASGAISIAQLVTFVMFLFFLVQPLASFFGAITSVNQALGALGRIQEVLDLPTETGDDATIAAAAVAPSERPDDAPAIEFRDVRFRYPEAVVAARRSAESEALRALADAHVDAAAVELADGEHRDDDVLRGVSFSVPAGARVALVGPSGAGKSTTLALIERFYDPTGGAILLHGRDIRSLDRGELRAQLGYVEQDAPTLAGTIADNLRLASPTASDAECERVLRDVNLGDVLERSPLGLEAPVGEAGVMLSGGERQRLAIARALLAAPPILLLDESTSSLDGLNEQRMREAIDAVATGRTLIVIAHRLSTVVDSDHIVVIDRGEVVGQGTHSELVASTPLYRDLAKHQLLV